MCRLDTCLEAVKPAESWSTLQHDMQRSGRTTAAMPEELTEKWNVFLGAAFPDISPTLAPNGTVFTHAANAQLLALNPDGSLLWQKNLTGEGVYAPITVRADGNLYLPRQNTHEKLLGSDGSGTCGVPNLTRFGPAIGPDGAVYIVSGDANNTLMLRRLAADCSVEWTYNGSDGVVSDVTIGPDGGVYVAVRFALIKLAPATGSVLWTYPFGSLAGRFAIAADGTVLIVTTPNTLSAIRPNGTLKWSIPLTGLTSVQSAPGPAIAPDGTVYVVSKTSSGNQPTLVAVSSAGSELWRRTEGVSSGGNGLSPVVDGNGIVVFPVEFGDIVGLAPTTGQVRWRIDLGSDYVNTAPAIGEDGTLYVTTNGGYLRAYGTGCPAPSITTPPFVFRKVTQEGDTINSLELGNIEDFDFLADGRVTLQAHVASTGTSAVFTELVGSGFDSVARGSFISGLEVDQVGLPCYDQNGVRYLPVYLVTYGPAIFVDNALSAAVHSGAGAPILLASLDPWQTLDCNDNGDVLVQGKINGSDPPSLLVVHTSSNMVDVLLQASQSIDGQVVTAYTPGARGAFGDDGVPVLQAELFGAGAAVVTPSSILAQAGDVLGGHTWLTPSSSRRTADSHAYYLGTGTVRNLFSYTPTGFGAFERGAGDSVAGFPVLELNYFDVNDLLDTAYQASLLSGLGVFLNDQPIAIPGATQLDGVDVETVGAHGTGVSISPTSQVAFLGQRTSEPIALYVATLDFTFDSDGDLDVDAGDFAAFAACYAGTGTTVQGCDCVTEFDSSGNGEVDCTDWAGFRAAWTGPGGAPGFTACSPQACCFATGECADLVAAECVDNLGAPLGAGSNCSNSSCPLTQACCFGDGGCQDLLPGHCVVAGGLAGGVLTNCSPNVCPQLEACCHPNGTCTIDLPADCSSSGSSPQGFGTDCDTVTCHIAAPDIVWNSDPLSASRALRSIKVSLTAAVVASGEGSSAIRLRSIDLQNPNPPNPLCCPAPNFGAFEATTCTAVGEANECMRWVGPPVTVLESQGNAGLGNFTAARLQCTPFYMDWATLGGFSIFGAEVMPSSSYELIAYGGSCKGTESSCTNTSAPVQAVTRRSGDVAASYNPPGTSPQPDALDVVALVNKFRGLATAPSKSLTQLQPNVPELNADVNALDIVTVVDAFRGLAYPYSGPCPCPSAVTCNATPCTSPGQCSGGMCVKACNGGAYAGQPCINDTHCPGSTCGSGFCRDRCGRCN